jgi:hypothetical protein
MKTRKAKDWNDEKDERAGSQSQSNRVTVIPGGNWGELRTTKRKIEVGEAVAAKKT